MYQGGRLWFVPVVIFADVTDASLFRWAFLTRFSPFVCFCSDEYWVGVAIWLYVAGEASPLLPWPEWCTED